MKSRLFVLLVSCVFAGSSFASDYVPGRVLAKPANHAGEAAIAGSLKAAGAREIGRVPQIGVLILQVPAQAEARVIAALSNNPNFEFAEPDYTAQIILTPNDPYYASYQWHLPKVGAPAAWDTTTGSAAVTIAVVDSGVEATHPDLAGRVLVGYDFVNGDANPADDNGHGTAVAGVAAAGGNDGIGVAGAAWNVSILPVKVMNSAGSGSYSSIANGITYAADRGAKIINLSLSGTSSSSTLQNAVSYAWNKGVLLVAAAGNNGSSSAVYPAAYPNMVAVSATTSSDTLASFSSYGSFVDLSAPGQDITTSWLNSGYVTISGTSFSSPLTAGVAALALSRNPGLSNAQLSSLLTANTDDLGAPGYDIYFGAGRLNAAKVVAAAVPVADTVAPATSVTNPKNGVTISGSKLVNVSVASSDNVGVTKAELYINGRLVASSSSGNFTYNWNTSKLARGTYQLRSMAYDAAGNAASSVVVSVTR
ncbi:MAG: S8 family serine peptidase [Chthoniobacterales bacterium]|nr:S8 family serine peptidase [Chthoniobacterales bacterium]